MKKQAVAVGCAAIGVGLLVAGEANAASVLDTTMKTAMSSGFTDLLDTIKDVISTSWQYVIGGAVLGAAPGLVLKMVHRATGK